MYPFCMNINTKLTLFCTDGMNLGTCRERVDFHVNFPRFLAIRIHLMKSRIPLNETDSSYKEYCIWGKFVMEFKAILIFSEHYYNLIVNSMD